MFLGVAVGKDIIKELKRREKEGNKRMEQSYLREERIWKEERISQKFLPEKFLCNF